MKTFYFCLMHFLLTITSCDSTDKKYLLDEWRCGAPIVREYLAHRKLNFQNKGSSINFLQSGFTAISKENIERYEEKLFPLSRDEKELVKIISERFLPPIIHRTSVRKLKLILKSKKGLVSPTKLGVKPSMTQPVEQRLFSGEDCIFASVAYPVGEKDFGDVIIKFKNKHVFSWGSLYAGHTWIRGVLGLSVEKPMTPKLKLEFSKQVFVSNHYAKIISYQIIQNIRLGVSIRSWGEAYNKKNVLNDILASSEPTDFWNKIYKFRLAFLEAHFIENISVDNIDVIFVKIKDNNSISTLMKNLNLDQNLLRTY